MPAMPAWPAGCAWGTLRMSATRSAGSGNPVGWSERRRNLCRRPAERAALFSYPKDRPHTRSPALCRLCGKNGSESQDVHEPPRRGKFSKAFMSLTSNGLRGRHQGWPGTCKTMTHRSAAKQIDARYLLYSTPMNPPANLIHFPSHLRRKQTAGRSGAQPIKRVAMSGRPNNIQPFPGRRAKASGEASELISDTQEILCKHPAMTSLLAMPHAGHAGFTRLGCSAARAGEKTRPRSR